MKQAALSVTSLSETRGLSSGAHRLLIGLLTYRNRETGRCDPAISTLCKRVGGVSKRTIFRWLAELRSKGILAVGSRSGTSSSYVFHSGKLAVETCEPVPMGDDKSVMGGDDKVVMGGDDRSVTHEPPLPYMNQTVLNLQKGTDAADKLRSSMDPPVKKAAAAAVPLFDDEPEAPPAPPQATPKTSRVTEHESAQVRVQSSDPVPALALAMVGELGKVHPQPGLLPRAVPEIERILRAGPTIEAAGERIWNNHAAWREYWATLEAGRFIPQLWRWFRDGDWETPPVIRKPAKKEGKLDAFAREFERRRAARRA
jgi:hypothetical protein